MNLVTAATFNGEPDHHLHALVTFVVVEGHDLAVAVDAQGELREVVGTNRESVKVRRELVDQDHVVGNLAHGVDLETVVAASKSVFCHAGQNPFGLSDSTNERQHEHHVGEPHLLADSLHGLAFEREALFVRRVRVTRRPAKSDHRVVLEGFEIGPTQQAGVLVRLEV